MNYKGIEYVIRAGLGLNEWTIVILVVRTREQKKRPAFIKSAPACSLRQSCNHHRRIVGVCVRSWAEFYSDRGLVDPKRPGLPRPIKDTP